MTFMILGAMGTTVGAGTFASFTAQTANQSTFQTGSLVLTDQAPTGAVCYSTAGGSTDTNDNGACTALFTSANASIKRPGDLALADLTLANGGSVTGTLTGFMTNAANCVDSDVVGANYKGNGTVSTCQNVQLAIQEYSDATRTTPTACRYGNGASAVITGEPIEEPIGITGTSNLLKITVDGVVHDDLALALSGSYTRATLAAELQSVIRAATGGNELVAVTTTGALQISTGTSSAGNSIAIAAPTSGNSALTKVGFNAGGGASATGGQTTCTLASGSPDHTHTLGTFLAAYPTAPAGLPLSTLTPNQTRWYRLTLMLPPGADNELQGRKVTFSMSWTLTQT